MAHHMPLQLLLTSHVTDADNGPAAASIGTSMSSVWTVTVPTAACASTTNGAAVSGRPSSRYVALPSHDSRRATMAAVPVVALPARSMRIPNLRRNFVLRALPSWVTAFSSSHASLPAAFSDPSLDPASTNTIDRDR